MSPNEIDADGSGEDIDAKTAASRFAPPEELERITRERPDLADVLEANPEAPHRSKPVPPGDVEPHAEGGASSFRTPESASSASASARSAPRPASPSTHSASSHTTGTVPRRRKELSEIPALAPISGEEVPEIDHRRASWRPPRALVVAVRSILALVLGIVIGSWSVQENPESTSPQSPVAAVHLLDIENDVLELPIDCAEAVGANANGTLDFASGRADGSIGSVAVEASFPFTETVAAVLRCTGANTEFDSIALFSNRGELLDAVEPEDAVAHGFRADAMAFILSDIRGTSNGLYGTISSIRVVGDDTCAGCAGSAEAELSFTILNEQLSFSVSFYRIDSTLVFTSDREAAVFYAAASSGDEAKILAKTTPENLEPLRSECVGGPCADAAELAPNGVRARQFPQDGTVHPCVLAEPIDSTTGVLALVGDDSGRSVCPEDPSVLQPGDFICGVDIPGAKVPGSEEARNFYPAWLVMRMDTTTRMPIFPIFGEDLG